MTVAAPAMEPGGPLGTNGKSASALPGDGSDAASVAHRARLKLRDLAGDLLPGFGVEKCGWRRIPGQQVRVMMRDGRAGIAGVTTCGSVWSCPVCAVKVAKGRAEEIGAAIERFEAMGGTVGLLTLTVRHGRDDTLAENLEGLVAAMRRLWAGRWAKRFRARWGLVGQVRNLECTWGLANGWHPHAHVVLFLGEHDGGAMFRRFGPSERAEMEGELKARWMDVAACEGFDVSWSRGATLEVQDPDRAREKVVYEKSGFGEYVAKLVPVDELWGMGEEMTWAHIKRTKGKRYTPWMLLAACGKRHDDDPAADGENRAPALWQEYSAAFKGRRQLVWSRGLKARLLADFEERSDEDLANAQDEEATELCDVPTQVWTEIRRQRAVPRLLDAAEREGVEGVRAVIVEMWVHVDERNARRAGRMPTRRGDRGSGLVA